MGLEDALLVALACLLALRHLWTSRRLRRELGLLRAENADLRQGERRYRSIIQASPDAIAIADMDGCLREVNSASRQLFGIKRDQDVLGSFAPNFLHPEDRSQAAEMLAQMSHGKLCGPVDLRGIREDGSQFYVSMDAEFIHDAQGAACGIVFIGRDISERKAMEMALAESNRRLAELSNTDGLTGISNRRRFDEVLFQEYARHARSRRVLSLIMLDVDHFKRFNDAYGHQAGDECLKRVAAAMRRVARRSSDLVARYGGEEFVCILPETDHEGAQCVAERIRSGIRELGIPHASNSTGEMVSASLGVVSVRCAAGRDPCRLVARVDEQLYRAKAQGRDQVCSLDLLVSEEDPHAPLVPLVWKPEYLSGHAQIDQEHQRLFRLGNELLELVATDGAPREMEAKVETLLQDLANHFRHEEGILQYLDFRTLQEHKRDHCRILSLAEEKYRSFLDRQAGIREIFDVLVYDVVRDHMFGADRQYYPLTRGNGLDPASGA
jgi:diguanylate cyclase (GGDEF)-like protein/PAS domain S-box-containing protein/hemerythrin-like metal-binding protein